MKSIMLSLVFAVSTTSAFAATHKVSIEGFTFEPKQLTAKVGDTIVWTNTDSAAHTVTADDTSFDSSYLGEGETWELTVSSKGKIPYHCDYHGHMKGTLIVQ